MNKSTKLNSLSLTNVALLATLLVTGVACSHKNNPATDLSKMKVFTEERAPTLKEKAEAEALAAAPPVQIAVTSTADNQKNKPATIVGIDEVIALGKYLGPEGAMYGKIASGIWKIIDKNKASVDIESKRLSILPRDARERAQVGGFKRPITRAFTVRMKNPYGAEVVKYDYAISFSYGGNVNGRGRYINNLMVIHSSVKVLWGFNLEAAFVTHDIQNEGTPQNPVVAISGEVRWKVKNLMTDVRKSNAFYVSGNGEFTTLNNSDRQVILAKRK